MASSSGNESENSMEESAPAPARRTRSGRAPAAKPARRGRRRGGTPNRSTRNTRKSLRIQQEPEEMEEMIEQENTHAAESDDELQNGSGSDGEEQQQRQAIHQVEPPKSDDVSENDDSDVDSSTVAQESSLKATSEDAEMEENSEDDQSQDSSEPLARKTAAQVQFDQAEESLGQSEDQTEVEEMKDVVQQDSSEEEKAEEEPMEEEPQAVLKDKKSSSANQGAENQEAAPQASASPAAKTKAPVLDQPEPTSEKKRKRRGFSDAPVEDAVPPVKKQNLQDEVALNGDVADSKEENASSPDSGSGDKPEHRRKKLPELNKYWKAVKEDASDFTGWTYLLQYVDQETDVDAAREAYDAFLSLYPYCYGYWRKFADYEKKKGTPEFCDQQPETTELSTCTKTTLPECILRSLTSL